MGNKIITEKDFWMCTGGNVPAQLQSMQRTTQTKEGEKYITIIDTATTCYIDFGCKKLMLIMAIVAAVIAVAVVATGGAALIAIGALAGAAGAAFGAVMGGLICGQVAKMARVWLGSKSNMIVQGKPAITSGHKMKCMLFGDEITHAPNIKNYWQAVSLAGGNYTGGILEGMMAGAAVGMGGAFIGGGRAAFLEGGTKAVGQAALEFLKVMPKNFGLNAIESFSKFGLGMRGVMGAQNTATTYGNTGTASIGDFAKGTVAMETGAYDSFNNIKEGKGTWQDYIGMAMMVAPVGKGKRDLENEISKKADDAEATKRAANQEGGSLKPEEDFGVFENSTGGKTPFDTIAGDGYRSGLEDVIPSSKSIKEASFTKENISKVEEHLTKDQISNKGILWENNQIMIERLKAIEKGELEATTTDKAFITHEMRESELMGQGKSYEEAHAQTCKEYGFNTNAEKGTPHPFYTPEAENALYNAELKRMGLN